ncbi:hypothetical protein [Pseudobythopirellula maris]|uniref:hypothetical protein n=1 Tax=Pseudobythopirellula maris TaxID=2527991 RepID=UPI0011B76A67|nr:hypothetical protein [Pseudobythopirellula maris]
MIARLKADAFPAGLRSEKIVVSAADRKLDVRGGENRVGRKAPPRSLTLARQPIGRGQKTPSIRVYGGLAANRESLNGLAPAVNPARAQD